MKNKDIYEVVAHRGDRAYFPENSLSAMRSALEKGCSFIEFDLQLSTDGYFYLLHDDDFKRTAGINQSILNMTTIEIDSISVHEPKRFHDTFKPTAVPQLKDALALLKQFPLAKAMVEIKQDSIDQWGLEKVINQLLQELQDVANQCVLISFNYDALVYAQHTIDRKSNLALGWVLKKYNQKSLEKALQLKPKYLIMNKTKTTNEKAINTGDWVWMLYGIQTMDEAKKYAEQGYYLMETDDISVLLQDNQQEHSNGL